jgi:hypothetical protein
MNVMCRLAAFAALLVIITPGSVRADGFVTPFMGYDFGGDSASCGGRTDCSPRRTNYGLSLGTFGASVGFEEDLSYTKDFFGATPGTKNSVFSAMSNVLFLGASGRVRSYVVSGLGVVRSSVSDDRTRADSNLVGYDVGGGALASVAKHIGLRFDVRRFGTFQRPDVPLAGGKLSFWRASLGLGLQF